MEFGSPVQDIVHGLHSLLLHVGKDVRVQVQGDGDGRVPEHLLDDLRVDSLHKEQRGTRVPQIVEPCALGKTGLPQQGLQDRLVMLWVLREVPTLEENTYSSPPPSW